MITKEQLAPYHFNKDLSGEILRKWSDDSGLTRPEIADTAGIAIATYNNSLYGKVQDLTIDRTFKIATATGHSVYEYFDLQLEASDPALAAEVRRLNEQYIQKKYAKKSAHIAREHENNKPIPDTLLDRFKRVYEGTIGQMRDQISQMKDSRAIMQEQYIEQIKAMEDAHKNHIKVMEDAHKATLERADKQIARLEKQISRLRIALIIETSSIGLLFFVDALVGARGWILRSFLRVGDEMSFVRRG